MNKFNVVYCCDFKLLIPTLFSIRSLFETNDRDRLCVHVVAFGDEKRITEAFETTVARLNIQCHLVLLPQALIEDMLQGLAHKKCYTRLLIHKVLDLDTDRILYVDGDAKFSGDISLLMKFPFDGMPVAAASDVHGAMFPGEFANPFLVLGLPLSAGYFNSGVLLIDWEKWRSQQIPENIIAYAKRKQRFLACPDQDAMNGFLKGNWKRLPLVWNYQRCGQWSDVPEIDVKIWHWIGIPKPWHLDAPFSWDDPRWREVVTWYLDTARETGLEDFLTDSQTDFQNWERQDFDWHDRSWIVQQWVKMYQYTDERLSWHFPRWRYSKKRRVREFFIDELIVDVLKKRLSVPSKQENPQRTTGFQKHHV